MGVAACFIMLVDEGQGYSRRAQVRCRQRACVGVDMNVLMHRVNMVLRMWVGRSGLIVSMVVVRGMAMMVMATAGRFGP